MHSEIAAAVVVPGWGARTRRRWLAVALLAVGVVAPVAVVLYTVFTGRSRVALSLDSSFLATVVFVGVAAVVARLIALVDVWLAAGRPSTFSRSETAVAVVAIGALLVGSVAVVEVERARASIAPAFTSAGDEALYDSEEPVVADDITSSDPDEPPTAATAVVTIASQPASARFESDVVEVIAPASSTASTASTTSTAPQPIPHPNGK